MCCSNIQGIEFDYYYEVDGNMLRKGSAHKKLVIWGRVSSDQIDTNNSCNSFKIIILTYLY